MTFVRCHLMLCYFSKGLNLCVSVLYINEVQVCFGWQYYPWQSLANVTVFSRTWKSSVEDRSVHTIVWIIASNILKRHQIADVVQHTGTQGKAAASEYSFSRSFVKRRTTSRSAQLRLTESIRSIHQFRSHSSTVHTYIYDTIISIYIYMY